jgi:drug/metabolite transporter (DMT)-like permease
VPLVALGIILCAAVSHAGWNLLVKQARNKQVFLMWSTLCSLTCFPALLFLPPLLAPAWPFVPLSALVEALYLISLAWAYTIGDFSLVYPIARGAAPILLTLWATLFLKEAPSTYGLLGIFVLVIGLMIVGAGASWKMLASTKLSFPGIAAALLTALCISIYSTIDGAAVHIADPPTYASWLFGLSALFSAPFILWRYGTRMAALELQENWPSILLVGFLLVITYGAVLIAYSLGPVSYVGSVREVSIVFGALSGWRFLGEELGLTRTIGAILIFAGIIVIAALG